MAMPLDYLKDRGDSWITFRAFQSDSRGWHPPKHLTQV